jgi:hypothetical protein
MPSAVGYQPTLATEMGDLQERITSTKNGSITSVQAIYVPADDITDPAPATAFAHLDATVDEDELLLLADAARDLPWRGTWRPALIACVFLACFNSSVLLYAYSAAKTEQMLREAADLQALAAERGDPCLNPDASVDPLVMPQVTSPPAYYGAVDRYGDPAAGTPVVRGPDFKRARANLLKPGCP